MCVSKFSFDIDKRTVYGDPAVSEGSQRGIRCGFIEEALLSFGDRACNVATAGQ